MCWNISRQSDANIKRINLLNANVEYVNRSPPIKKGSKSFITITLKNSCLSFSLLAIQQPELRTRICRNDELFDKNRPIEHIYLNLIKIPVSIIFIMLKLKFILIFFASKSAGEGVKNDEKHVV